MNITMNIRISMEIKITSEWTRIRKHKYEPRNKHGTKNETEMRNTKMGINIRNNNKNKNDIRIKMKKVEIRIYIKDEIKI